jgi:Flp pilus assembly protein TadG
VKRSGRGRAGERGVSLLFVTICIFVLFGMAGLAIDGGQMYATKQKAQAAADAGAQAGVMEMYRGTGDGAASATAYVQQNGFTAAEVAVDHPTCASLPWCNGHVTLSTTDDPNLIRVTVTRDVNTIFMRALGATASTVRAVATAAISLEPAPIPILVLHPTLSGSFNKNGSNSITICGGPTRSIQVNSTSTTSINISGVSGTVDLSHAGPLDTLGDCSTGTGADFANVGLQNPYPGTLLLGTKPGSYISPASPIEDPLLTVAPPAQPADAPAPLPVCGKPSTGAPVRCPVADHNCPASLTNNDACWVYSPGYYPDGIDVSGGYVQFRPGIYWINHGGFHLGSNTVARMAQGSDDIDLVTSTGWTGRMLVYNSPSTPVNATHDIFEITSNSGQINNISYPDAAHNCATGGNCLVGAPMDGTYEGILFFQNRTTASNLTHSFSGGGGLSLTGTIYLTHTAASIRSDGKYQSVNLQGNSGGTTKVEGEIITDVLSLGGTSGVTMNLIATPTFEVRQVALVQ